MKVAKLLVALSGTLVLIAILVLPQIIEARRGRAAATPSPNVVRANRMLPLVRRYATTLPKTCAT
jgi:hypothetical protein